MASTTPSAAWRAGRASSGPASGRASSGRASSGREGSGPAGSGRAGVGRASSGREGSGPAGSGRAGVGRVLGDWRIRFALLTFIWGGSFLFIKVGLEALAPIQIALARIALGAAVLLAILFARREPLPREPVVWLHLAVAGVLLNTVPFTLFALAEQHISSALAGIFNATTPIFTLLVVLLVLPEERPTPARWLGLAVGFAGVALLLAGASGIGPRDTTGALLALAASACYGLGWTYVRRTLSGRAYSSLALSAGQLVAGTIQLAVVAPLVTAAPTELPVHVLLAIVALGALGTGVAYVLQYGLIRDVGATTASTTTYFIPIVSMLIGVIALGEELAWNAPAGAIVIIGGALLARRSPGSSPGQRFAWLNRHKRTAGLSRRTAGPSRGRTKPRDRARSLVEADRPPARPVSLR